MRALLLPGIALTILGTVLAFKYIQCPHAPCCLRQHEYASKINDLFQKIDLLYDKISDSSQNFIQKQAGTISCQVDLYFTYKDDIRKNVDVHKMKKGCKIYHILSNIEKELQFYTDSFILFGEINKKYNKLIKIFTKNSLKNSEQGAIDQKASTSDAFKGVRDLFSKKEKIQRDFDEKIFKGYRADHERLRYLKTALATLEHVKLSLEECEINLARISAHSHN